MSIRSILPVHFSHPEVELGAIYIAQNGMATIYATPNMGKTIEPYLLHDLKAAINFLEKIEPLNQD